jgi:2-succinyl-5-enolpyruvyl-6-hydroxy-3-cyclohexene-1-carboxylate synthase
MPHPKQHISDVAEICRLKGVSKIVISPGSRSAPLIQAFYHVFGENCLSLVDERSAAYFALGIALYTGTPVVLICTSGTAVLNYAPAMAEAYYQGASLLAVTADRPKEWIDQQDNQTLRQSGIYRNYCKGNYDLPQVITSADDLWYAHRTINEAVNLSLASRRGPVHINVPLTDPLYGDLPDASERLQIIQPVMPELNLRLPDELEQEWKQAQRIMIIHGQDSPGSAVSASLSSLSGDARIIIMAENISNVTGKNTIANSNLVLAQSRNAGPEYPDLILHSGGQVVSKALTGYLRKADNISCWRLGEDFRLTDTFKLATRHISLPADAVYRSLAGLQPAATSASYRETWLKAASRSDKRSLGIMKKSTFCDLTVFHHVMRNLPAGMILAPGNSSIIRYMQLFASDSRLSYFGNRGVSGIDGALSTAAGIAHASGKLTLAVAGDLGFLYDSNAMWNNALPSKLRILVINNGGGGIFHILKGPSEHPGFKKFIEANHPVNLEKLAGAYGLNYFGAREPDSLAAQWPAFLDDRGRAAVFEVKTDAELSASAFRRLMEPFS